MCYIFSWKIKPTNSMQSIACIMVVNARCTLPVCIFGEATAAYRQRRATSGASGLASIRTHFCFQYLYNSKERFRSTSGCLLFALKITLYSNHFSLFDPRFSDYIFFFLLFCQVRITLYT